MSRSVRRGQQCSQIQAIRSHQRKAAFRTGPLLARPVPVQLDPVPVGIGEIDGLAHAVVGGPVEPDASVEHPLDSDREVMLCGIADGNVREAGVALRRRWASTCDD